MIKLPKVIGHRGVSGYAPENTLISMTMAKNLGVTWVEFDVMLTGCGEPIIFHDHTLDRTTGTCGEVALANYCDISKLDCGSWFSKEYAGEKIPTLAQLLDHIVSLELAINIEIKPYPGFDIETAQKALEILKVHWPNTLTPPLVSSFSPLVLEIASAYHFPLGFIIDSWETSWEKMIDVYRCVSLHVHHLMLTEKDVERIKQTGRSLLAFTVNEKPRADELFSWGVDSLFSDFPDRIA